MQRNESDGIVISCDFCGTDWDPYDQSCAKPMVEGHHGSVICLDCVKLALDQLRQPDGPYACALCIRQDIPAELPSWSHPGPIPSAGLNVTATACRDCIYQAAGRFSKDKDVDFKWRKGA